MDFGKFDPVIGRINSRIEEVLVGVPENLYNASRHLSLAGGKRIRPLLCMLSCEAVCGKKDNAFQAGVAIELIHTFTLVHDDMMDNDLLRRGVPSVHAKFGEPTAIIAGDLLFAKAFEICDPVVACTLAKASSEICEGQELDMSFEERDDVTEEEYLEMIKKKTAVLFEAATRSGAVLGGGNDREVRALARYGLDIGMAFQIHDDVLGIIAKEEKLGKPVGSDIVEGKMSLIAIKTLEKLPLADKGELINILKKDENTEEEVERAVGFFREYHAVDYCKKKAEGLIEDAKKSLGEIADSRARDDLMDIADFVVGRNV